MEQWIPPELSEQTGPSVLVSEQCWLFTWRVSAQQQLELKDYVKNPLFERLLVQAAIKRGKVQTTEKLIHDKFYEAFGSVDLSSSENTSLNLFRSIAMACKGTLDLEEVSFRTCHQFDGDAIAFSSSRHIVCGVFLGWIKELIWTLVCKSANLGLSHTTPKQVQVRCNKWKDLNNRIDSDWLLSSVLVSAKRRGVHAMPVDWVSGIWQIGMCTNIRLVRHSCNDMDSHLGVMIAQNKRSSSSLLKRIGCNVPREILLPLNGLSRESLSRLVAEVGFPCVVKPVNADGGVAVTANINNHVELAEAIAMVRNAKRQQALLQEHVSGDDYRLFIINCRLTCVIKRIIPHLVGDGVSTLKELLLNENKRREDLQKSNFYAYLLDDQDVAMQAALRRSGYEWSDVLGENVRINLRSNANVKTGGLRIIVPLEKVHLSLKTKCEAIAHTFRLNACGVDYISEDLQRDLFSSPSSGAFIEVNAIPDCPSDRSEIILDGLESHGTLNLGVHVCVADWSGAVPRDVEERIEFLVKNNENAVIAIKNSYLPAVLNFLSPDVARYLQGYEHVHDPILNHCADVLIYCIAPDELIQHGFPVRNVKTLDVFCPDQSLSISRDLERLKAFIDE